jgi:hypothetical protein
MAKNQKLTSQVEKTAVEKCDGITEKRIMRTIYHFVSKVSRVALDLLAISRVSTHPEATVSCEPC